MGIDNIKSGQGGCKGRGKAQNTTWGRREKGKKIKKNIEEEEEEEEEMLGSQCILY